MAAKKSHYHVQIRRNGAVCGTFGPYAKKADALADAGSLGGPGVKVAVVSGSGSSCPSCPGKAPAKRRNTSKAEDGLKRRLATYDRKVAAISNDDDVLAAVRYLDKVESWAYQNGVNLDHATVSRLRKAAFSAGEAAGRGRRAARGQEIQRLHDEKRAAEKPYDWMRRNASTSHRGVRIQRTAGVTRFTHPLTGKRVSVAQRDGGLKGAKALIDAALDRKPVRRVANRKRSASKHRDLPPALARK